MGETVTARPRWRCRKYNPFIRKAHHAIVTFEDGVPKILGCLECDWDDVVYDTLNRGEDEDKPEPWEREEFPTRCLSYKLDGGRCGNIAGAWGVCGRHENKAEKWDRIYNGFRSQWAHVSMPEVYREVFVRAIQDAELVADAQQVTRATFEEARRLRHASVVYFVKRQGFIKIGTTTSLRSRLVSLSQGGCKMPDGVESGPVELLATTPGDRRTESQYHHRFEKQRVAGEWFRPNKALLRLVEDLQRAERNGQKDILDQVLDSA